MADHRKVRSKDRAPVPTVVWDGQNLIPAMPYDAEALDAFPRGSRFDLKPIAKAANPLRKLYWMILAGVARASETWPDSTRLHRDIKMSLGYVTKGFDLHLKRFVDVPDSTDMDAMNDAEFQTYFDQAMRLLASHIGYDPKEVLPPQTRKPYGH